MSLLQTTVLATQPLTKKMGEWRVVIGTLIILVAAVFLAFMKVQAVHEYMNGNAAVEQIAIVVAVLYGLLATGLIVSFFIAFKGVHADERRLDRAITYSYVFVMFALFGSVLPFFFLPHVPALTGAMRVTPIGVVRGCSALANGSKQEMVPVELRCNGMSNQWVINFGGVIWTPGIEATRVINIDGGEGARTAPNAGATAARQAASVPPATGGGRVPPAAAGNTATTATTATTVPPAGTAATATAASGAPATAAAPALPGAAVLGKLPRQEDMNVIQGGLVVPLYVVVLSLMGASVSMTRRVPEYQRRLSTKDPEFMSYDQAREALVFQVMQVFSAPLIAVTMYYLIDPGSRASTIVLAFASGFSSETILLSIRALLEKIKPTTVVPAKAANNISISPARLDFGKIEVGNSVHNVIAIVNPTAVDLEVMSISCTGTGEFAIAAKFPIAVSAGKSVPVQVTFAPTSPGSKKGVLAVTDNAPGSPRSIDIFGEGVTPVKDKGSTA